MAKIGRGARRVIFEFLVHGAFGFGLSIVSNAIVEIARIPVLNDTGTFGNPHMSNFEYLSYGIGSFGTVAGLASLGLKGQSLLGFTYKAMPFTAGFAAGTYIYEHTLVPLLGIRKFNPYELFGHLLPPVLPPGTPHPGVSPGKPFPGSWEAGPAHPGLPA